MKRTLKILIVVAIWLAVTWKLRDKLLPLPRPDRGPVPHITGTPTPHPATAQQVDTHTAATSQHVDAPPMETETSDAAAPDDLQLLKGIGPVYSSKLADRGITTFDTLAAAPSATIAEELGVPIDAVDDWKTQARSMRSGNG